MNADQIKCTDCVLQWKWTAKHRTPYENFENCADISLTGGNSESNGSQIQQAPKDVYKTTTTDQVQPSSQTVSKPSTAVVSKKKKKEKNSSKSDCKNLYKRWLITENKKL